MYRDVIGIASSGTGQTLSYDVGDPRENSRAAIEEIGLFSSKVELSRFVLHCWVAIEVVSVSLLLGVLVFGCVAILDHLT